MIHIKVKNNSDSDKEVKLFCPANNLGAENLGNDKEIEVEFKNDSDESQTYGQYIYWLLSNAIKYNIEINVDKNTFSSFIFENRQTNDCGQLTSRPITFYKKENDYESDNNIVSLDSYCELTFHIETNQIVDIALDEKLKNYSTNLPIIMDVINTSDNKNTIHLFSKLHKLKNCIVSLPLYKSLEYDIDGSEIIKTLLSEEYKYVVFESNTQATNAITVTSYDEQGHQVSTPIPTLAFMSSTHKNMKSVNIDYPFKIDKNTILSLTLNPNQKVRLSFFK